jgi:SH3 domain protein
MIRAVWLALLLLPTALFLALPVAAETAWVKDELRLNLRTGPGTEFRIKGNVGTGDRLDVLERATGWTKVSSPELGEGWIPEGFLQAEPPAGIRLERTEAETAEFRSQFESISQRSQELEESNATLSERDATQKQEIETLTRENLELRAGARWPEWITGAGILVAGMLMGAILHSISARRSRPRIRL